MSEDKRLNEVIRVQKRPNNFVMIDKGFTENPELSWKAKGILAYLLGKPNNWKVIVPDLINHAKMLSIHREVIESYYKLQKDSQQR